MGILKTQRKWALTVGLQGCGEAHSGAGGGLEKVVFSAQVLVTWTPLGSPLKPLDRIMIFKCIKYIALQKIAIMKNDQNIKNIKFVFLW